MTDIIETMARAIYESQWVGDYPTDGVEHALAIQNAQAAITALTEAGYAIVPREPDEAMVKVGVETECGLGPYTLPDVIAASYRAMINAATNCNHTNNGKAE